MADDDQVGHLQRRPVRLVDVARAVGVSVMTVSNVINGRLNSVSADTTLRVRAELKRLNYRPNAAARSLRHARTHSVGMLIVNDDPAFLAAPFTTHLVAGLSNFLTESSYSLTIQGYGLARWIWPNCSPTWLLTAFALTFQVTIGTVRGCKGSC